MSRVVLVDCYANPGMFVGDEAFRALATQLRAEGVEATRLDFIRDDPPPGKGLAEVLAALRAAAPSLVVLSRAWSEDIVAALRGAAAPAARIVRYSHGAPSAIDACFDAVVDADGLRALLAGAGAVAAPAWRRTKRELAAAPPLALPEADGRPTISGPARGCPFLVDVRSSPAYRDSDIDFDRVQSKGCSFCLDNVGAYAAFSEAEVVAAWLAQLRAVRRARPDVREVLLTDERPHPYLPAFFRAVGAEPALHGIELLVKSRVDWLVEHADGALREACELAAASGSVLHVYLVGFESFHQADLDLFNKAVTVADNVRAIETLRALAARHPHSFEFRRLRTHGVLLFHPWTTPESLLDNARVMRAVRFDELRVQALRTRLRLYASVPLHALAARQGLLVERFADGRGDRAVEQGYDASVPWRFADLRVEAIFQAANRLADAWPELGDADVLEMATSFVQRWPGFAAAPELAALPLVQAPYAWGASPADVVAAIGASAAAFDRELEAVAAGEKPACLKEGVRREEADALVAAYRVMGLAAAVVSTDARGGDDGRHGSGETHARVAVARDGATLDQVLTHQRALESGQLAHVPAMGALMGYPRCCIEALAAHATQGDNLDLEREPLRAHPDRPLAPLLNRFGAAALVSHLLCRPDCPASLAQARARLAAVGRVDPAAGERIAAHLASAVLQLDYRRAALVEGEWDGERYALRALRPFRRADLGVDPAAVRALRLAPGEVVFELGGGGAHVVAAAAPLLVEPGRPLAPAAQRAIRAPHPAPSSPSHAAAPPGPPAAAAAAVPDLPAVLAPGAAVGEHVVERVEAEAGGGARVVLGRGTERLTVLVRPWIAARPALSRRGAWALDLDHPGPASAPERALIGALARLLPGGHRQTGAAGPDTPVRPSPPPRPPAAERPTGVICTTPWTTLEVVDPDGRARQCCSDWTVGDRGNLHEQPLLTVWNGDGYRMARRVMGGGVLGSLCNPICPRLYDGKFAERELTLVPGAEPFVANQRLLFEDIAARREVVRGRPLYIAVCPSTYCNYDCIMCLCGRTPRRDLPESVWDELLSMLPSLHVLTLLGGEPLANPLAMRFLRAWDRTAYPDAAVSVITNGSLLTAGVLAQLERCRFDSVTVSLNAGTPAVYEAVQRGIALADVLANLDALVEHRRRQEATFPIILSFVVQPANHATLIPFAELARARDLRIRLLPLNPHGPEGLDFYDDGDAVARILASLQAMADWAEGAAPHYRREIHGTRMAIAAEAARRRHPERAPRQASAAS